MRALTYREFLIGLGLALSTVRNYERELSLVMAWFSAHGLDLRNVLPSHLAEYAATRPNSHSVRSHLRAALTHYWEWQEVAGWPRAIKVPSQATPMCKALDPDEATALVKTASGWWREGTAVLAGCYLGLRNFEIGGMRWDGFDRNLDWYRLVGKNNRERDVPVHAHLATELAPYRRQTGFVFEGRFGEGVTHATVWNWVRKVAAASGIEGEVWPHRLRHTALATANDNTGDLRSVQTFAGHAKPETTSGYTRTTAARLRAVSDALDYI